jgi:cysteinyl-tRNA synthetase
MDDDFNTPRALAAVFELATVLNRTADAVARADPRDSTGRVVELEPGASTLQTLAGVLGLTLTASMTPAQRAGLHQLARELAHEHPDLFDHEHPVLQMLRTAAADAAVPGEDLVRFIAEGRMRARHRKDWATGDAIRSRLHGLGILIKDSPTGFTWRLR